MSTMQEKLKGAVEGFKGFSDLRTQLKDLGVKVISDERLKERVEILATLHWYVLERPRGYTPEEIFLSILEKFDNVDNILRRVAIPWGRAGSRPAFAQFMRYYEKMISRARSKILSVQELMSLQEAGVSTDRIPITVQQGPVEHREEEEEEEDEDDEVVHVEAEVVEDLSYKDDTARLAARGPTAWRIQRPMDHSRRLINKNELLRVLQTYLSEEVYSRALFLCDLSFLEMDVLPSWAMSMQQQQIFQPATTPFIPGANLQPVLSPPKDTPTDRRLKE